MSPPVRVALLGFTPFEREHIEPALRTPRRRKPAYTVRIDELRSCNLAIVDADQEAAVAQVLQQGRLASVVMVGSTPRPGAGAQLSRPIQLPALLDALDALVAAAPPMSAEVQKVQDTLARLLSRPAQGVPPPAPASPGASTLSPEPAPDPNPAPHPPPRERRASRRVRAAAWPVIAGPAAVRQRGRALLVDARDDSLRFLLHELDPIGLSLDRVAGGGEALDRVQRETYDFIFLAAGHAGPGGPEGSGERAAVSTTGSSNTENGQDGSDGMDGFHTCRLLQRLPPAQPVAPPATLVLLLADDSPVSRLRAERAGADAWLGSPWAAEPLLKIVEERERWLQQAGLRG